MGEIGCRTLKGVKKRKKMNLERLTLIYRGEKREREKKKKKLPADWKEKRGFQILEFEGI
jgi:hypothetical protein